MLCTFGSSYLNPHCWLSQPLTAETYRVATFPAPNCLAWCIEEFNRTRASRNSVFSMKHSKAQAQAIEICHKCATESSHWPNLVGCFELGDDLRDNGSHLKHATPPRFFTRSTRSALSTTRKARSGSWWSRSCGSMARSSSGTTSIYQTPVRCGFPSRSQLYQRRDRVCSPESKLVLGHERGPR